MNLTRRDFLAGTAALAVNGSVDAGEALRKPMLEDNVLELRQYTLRGAQRDTLISLFEQSFIESQNLLGAHVLGCFRDLDDPDRFVWIRGFSDMTARQAALEAFYGGPVWKAHRNEANATIVDSDNVLLLRPASTGQGFPSQAVSPGGIIGATLHYLGKVDAAQFVNFFDASMLPQLKAAGAQPIARLVSEESANNFPRLPVRERDRAFVWLARWNSVDEHDAFVRRSTALGGWRDSAPEAVLPALMQKPERLRLAPTQRSPLR